MLMKGNNANGNIGQSNVIGAYAPNRDTVAHDTDIRKVTSYESDYIGFSDPGSYDDTGERSNADDAKRHKSTKKLYNPNVPLEDFCLDVRFPYSKLYKKELVQFLTRERFKFNYIKNGVVRVMAECSAGKGCSWLILCSWCFRKKIFVVKTLCVKALWSSRATTNSRVTAHVVANMFGEVISSAPFIKPRHLEAMVRKKL